MFNNLDKKQLIASVTATLISGLVLNIIIPIIALFLLDVFITFISLFDPLHQGKNIENAWAAFIGMAIIQVIFPTLASIATGVAISFLTQKHKAGTVYLIGIVISVFIYMLFQVISLALVGVFASEIVVVTWLFVSLAIVGFGSIIIGIICVAINRKMIINRPQQNIENSA